MNPVEIEREMARLDALYRPIATRRVDLGDLDAWKNLGASIAADLASLDVDHDMMAVLQALIDVYATGGELVRATVRQLFNRYTSFRWAAQLPRDWDTAEQFRARLIHLSARDQGADARDEILTLQALCDQARQARISIEPIIDEVAAMSSDVDRYGMGSMRSIIGTYGNARTS